MLMRLVGFSVAVLVSATAVFSQDNGAAPTANGQCRVRRLEEQ